MNLLRPRVSFRFFLALLLGAPLGCASARDDGASASADEELSNGAHSGYAECPGTGWSTQIVDWKGVHGSYLRANPALVPAGELSQLTVFDDPSASNGGTPSYLRTVNGFAESGRVSLGTDNPAIGPIMWFLDGAMAQTKDTYWVLARKTSASGRITRLCLGKAAGADGKPIPGAKPFMLTRGF